MNSIMVNGDATRDALVAVVGEPTAMLVERVYDAIDDAEKRGQAAGFNQGDVVGFMRGEDDGYAEGYSDGINVSHTIAFDDGYDAGYDAGYEQARRDLGECPMVDEEFDEHDFWTVD